MKILGPLCNQTVKLKTDSKTLYYSIMKLKYRPFVLKNNKGWQKYSSSNNSHYNNYHRNYTNRIFLQQHMGRLINLCMLWDACQELFCIFKDFYVICRGNKITANRKIGGYEQSNIKQATFTGLSLRFQVGR